MPVPADPPTRRAFVDGVEVRELYVRLKPSPEGPAHFVSEAGGTHEFSRVDLVGGVFQFGHGNNKLGATSITKVDVFRDHTVLLTGHDGRCVSVPGGVVQTVNYLV